MTKRTIIIILVITVIIALIAFTTLKKEKTIEKVLLSDSYSIETDESDTVVKELDEFESSSEIYAVIMLKNITLDDSINIQWKRIEETRELLVQEDALIEKQEGSGPLVISLAKKNDEHESGTYKIYVKLNETEAIEKSFTVKE